MEFFKLVNIVILSLVLYILVRQVDSIQSATELTANETSNARIIYDQRQNGKYNIHIVIKDVTIIEMDQNEISDQNYNDDEYYYDEDDLTVKPLKSTTTSMKPLYSTTSTLPSQTTVLPITDQKFVTNLSSTSEDITTKFLLPPLLNTLTPATDITHTLTSVDHKNTHSSLNTLGVDIKSRSKIEPIYAFNENLAIQPQAQLRQAKYPSTDNANSKIFKLKIHRSHRSQKQDIKRCHLYHYKNSEGNCRENKSSSGSLLKHLLRMLVTLPFTGEQHHNDH